MCVPPVNTCVKSLGKHKADFKQDNQNKPNETKILFLFLKSLVKQMILLAEFSECFPPICLSPLCCHSFFRLVVHFFCSVLQQIIMSSSQRDMFLSSPKKSPRISSSLPARVSYVYLWCILFDWDEDVEKPFDIYQVARFRSSELKKKWISGELDLDSRKKRLSFSWMPGKSFSLYAKVEKCKLKI